MPFMVIVCDQNWSDCSDLYLNVVAVEYLDSKLHIELDLDDKNDLT